MDEQRSDGREERGEQTRQALLEAATRAFCENGYAGASVRDIARLADVHPALVAYHFGSKAKLFHRVIEEQVNGLRARLLEQAGPVLDRDGARRMLGVYLDHLEENPDFPRLVHRGVLDGDEEVVALLQQHFAILAGAIGGVSKTRVAPAQALLTLFGAAVVPYLYAPVLGALGTEITGQERRAHLQEMLDGIIGD